MYVYINVLHINSKYVKCDYVISNILFINTKKISETLIYIRIYTCLYGSTTIFEYKRFLIETYIYQRTSYYRRWRRIF